MTKLISIGSYWFLVIAILVSFIYFLKNETKQANQRIESKYDTALKILKKRLHNGEISQDNYNNIIKKLNKITRSDYAKD